MAPESECRYGEYRNEPASSVAFGSSVLPYALPSTSETRGERSGGFYFHFFLSNRDTAGQERYQTVTKQYYRRAQVSTKSSPD